MNGIKKKERAGILVKEGKEFSVRTGAASMLFILVVGVCFIASCAPGEPVKSMKKINLGISRSFLSVPVYIAKEQGYFSKEGLDVTVKEYSSGKLATRDLFAGTVDISTVADMPVVFNSFKRDDFCIFATFTHSYDFVSIITREDKGFKTGGDLKGKRVGANRGTSSHFFLGVYLIHNNLSISDVELVDIKTVDLPAALKNDEVDAISVWQPYSQATERLLRDDARELPHSEIYRTTFDFAVMKNFAEDHADILEKFIGAIDKAAAFMKDNKEKSQEIIAGRFKLDKDIVHSAWDDFVFDISLDQSLLVSWDEIARWAIKNKFTENKEIPNYFNFIHLDALEAVKPESITIIR